jgi:hypothetical protein
MAGHPEILGWYRRDRPAKKASRMNGRRMFLFGLAAMTIGGCAGKPTFDQGNVDALAQEIALLGPDIDPGEARRAAEIAFSYSLKLARDYNITDLPIIHNAKVHQGLRQRGLCNHWAEDLSARLNQENFRTLTILRAISPPTQIRIIHHTAVITRRGGTIYDGIVLDPWRHGGALFWARTTDDKRYNWRPREEVLPELIKASEEKAARTAN